MAETTAARLGAGDVEITLDGQARTLKPTLKAAIAISRMTGGLAGAMARVSQLDFDVIVAIIRAGLDLSDVGAKDLEAKVYRSGVGFESGLANQVNSYLSNLANGGKPREEAKDDEANPPEGEEA